MLGALMKPRWVVGWLLVGGLAGYFGKGHRLSARAPKCTPRNELWSFTVTAPYARMRMGHDLKDVPRSILFVFYGKW